MAVITKLEIQKRNKERVNVFLDEEYAFSISTELVYKENIKIKDEIDIEEFKKLVEKDSIIKCREAAIRSIEKNFKTEKQVKEKLILKGYEKEAINKAIDFLKQYNFLDDKDYANKFIKDKLKIQGSNKIKYTLMQRGIARDIIDEELNNIDKESEKRGALLLAQKKVNKITKTESDKYIIYNKVCRFLLSKGYNYDIIKDVVKEAMNFEAFD